MNELETLYPLLKVYPVSYPPLVGPVLSYRVESATAGVLANAASRARENAERKNLFFKVEPFKVRIVIRVLPSDEDRKHDSHPSRIQLKPRKESGEDCVRRDDLDLIRAIPMPKIDFYSFSVKERISACPLPAE